MDQKPHAVLNRLLTKMHAELLKPLGFRKTARTFSRDRGAYWERFHFQGSAWNQGDRGRFYLNVGVEFKDQPERRWWSGFGHTHWAGRIREMVPGAPADWEYGLDVDTRTLSGELAELIEAASRNMAADIERLRQRYQSEEAARKARAAEQGAAPDRSPA